MDTYTESLENRARDINPEDDIDYSAALTEVVSMFQNFDEALDTFLVRHGYTGDRQDIQVRAEADSPAQKYPKMVHGTQKDQKGDRNPHLLRLRPDRGGVRGLHEAHMPAQGL